MSVRRRRRCLVQDVVDGLGGGGDFDDFGSDTTGGSAGKGYNVDQPAFKPAASVGLGGAGGAGGVCGGGDAGGKAIPVGTVEQSVGRLTWARISSCTTFFVRPARPAPPTPGDMGSLAALTILWMVMRSNVAGRAEQPRGRELPPA